MIIVGDAFHNFTDGFAIAAAFMADTRLGIVTAIAIVAHELPQELGDFLVLLHSGFSKARALFWNLVSSLATLIGALIAYFAMQNFEQYTPVFLCFAASSRSCANCKFTSATRFDSEKSMTGRNPLTSTSRALVLA